MIKITLYYLKLCGFCKKFEKEWDRIKNLKSNDIILKKIENSSGKRYYANKELIIGYPTLVIRINNRNIVYKGDMLAESILNFISNHKIRFPDNSTYKYEKYKNKYTELKNKMIYS